MIVITGAAGFIGSCMASHLCESGRHDLVLVDDFIPMSASTCLETCGNASLQDMEYVKKIPRALFFDWLALNREKVDFIIHLDTEADTLPEDAASFHEYILEFSQRLWSFAAMKGIPLLYAASSSGDAEILSAYYGEEEELGRESGWKSCEQWKRKFDYWVMKQRITPPLWAGFSMPEVYGPREYDKRKNVSSVMRIIRHISEKGRVELPCFSISETEMEEPLEDRLYVNDVVTVLTWFMNHLPASGIYRLATGYPRPLSAVAKAVFSCFKMEEKIEFVPSSPPLKKLQPNRCDLPLCSLRSVGYKKKFTSLEKGIYFFVRDFLKKTTK